MTTTSFFMSHILQSVETVRDRDFPANKTDFVVGQGPRLSRRQNRLRCFCFDPARRTSRGCRLGRLLALLAATIGIAHEADGKCTHHRPAAGLGYGGRLGEIDRSA